MQRKEHVDERLAVTGRLRFVLHVGHVGVVEYEGHHPKCREQDRRSDHGNAVLPFRGFAMHRQDEQIPQEDEQQDDAVTQRRQRQQHGGGDSVAAGLQSADEHAEPEHRKGQRNGERELPRHRGRDVAAIDGEAFIEQKHRAGHHEQLRNRECESRQLGKQPRAQWQGNESGDGHQLQGDAVRQHHIESQDEQRRHHHVEAIDRQARVPVVAPAGQTKRCQQMVAQISRPVYVGTHVAARWRVVAEDQRRLQREEHHQGGCKDDDSGKDQFRATFEVQHLTGRHHATPFGRFVDNGGIAVAERIVDLCSGAVVSEGVVGGVRHAWNRCCLGQGKKCQSRGIER